MSRTCGSPTAGDLGPCTCQPRRRTRGFRYGGQLGRQGAALGGAELGNLNAGTRRCRVTNVRICRNEGVVNARVYAQACITFHVQPARLRRSDNCCATFSCKRIEPDRLFRGWGACNSRRRRAPSIRFCVNSLPSHQVGVQVSRPASRSPRRSLRCCPRQRGGDPRPLDIQATCTSSARPPRSQTREQRSAYRARTPR